MEDGPDRTTIEIKSLLHKLNPRGQSSHKDRVRALTRFRNFVSGANKKGKVSTPELFDDDLPLIFLGSESPTALYDDEQYGDLSAYTGLFQACSTPSQDHAGGLKRSARNAMHLVKYLALDHVDLVDGEPVPLSIDAETGLPELNPFADCLCTMKPSQLRIANFEQHLKDSRYDSADNNARNGAKREACEVLLLLFTRHYDPNQGAKSSNVKRNQNTTPSLLIEDLLSTPASRQSFDNWMVQNVNKEVQNAVKNSATRSPFAANSSGVGNGPTNLIVNTSGGGGLGGTIDNGSSANPFEDSVEVDIDVAETFRKRTITQDVKQAMEEAEAHAEEQLDELGIKLYKKDDMMNSDANDNDPPTSWKDSKLSKKQIQLSSAESESLRGGGADVEIKAKDEEKIRLQNAEQQKLIGRDPLGLRPDNFDLKMIQPRAIQVLQDAIEDLAEEMEDMDPIEKTAELARRRKRKKDKYAYAVEDLVSLGTQKNSLEAILAGDGEEGKSEADGEAKASMAAKDLSILPTDANFNPMLFLTLVHRNASYDQLKESLLRLDNQTDDQMQRIQERVQENFELYIRCADGIDLFSDKAGKTKNHNGKGVIQRISNLDKLADTCSVQAKKSFKPLLDNTNEVRKVQSALAVLNRVGPLLQVPSLMRQHIENGRFSAAVKAYRRVLVIDDDNRIDLLAHVKLRATEAARDARRDLECRLANPSLPVQSILDSIRDLGELNELNIPEVSDLEEKSTSPSKGTALPRVEVLGGGNIAVGEKHVDVRQHPPSLACLMLQTAHFSQLVTEAVSQAEASVVRIFDGETLAAAMDEENFTGDEKSVDIAPSGSAESKASTDKRERNRWKYDVLESRVIFTIKAVSIARTWLPRLLSVAQAARQAEKRRSARARNRSKFDEEDKNEVEYMKAFEVFVTSVAPSIRLLVQHNAFCALGCFNGDEGQELSMTYGENAMDRLQKLIKSPLPAMQTSKCAAEIAALADIVASVADSALKIRPSEDDYFNGFSKSPHHQRVAMESTLEEVATLVEEILVTIERRKCIYAFDQCARVSSQRASGSGVFDGNDVVSCVQKLSEELRRPESCAAEVDKGCELIIQKICDGLSSYVRDGGDSNRLRAVSECATALSSSIDDVVREVSYLTNSAGSGLEESLMDDVLTLEGMMFDDFLESIRRNIKLYCKLGPMDTGDEEEDESSTEKRRPEAHFPSHLSASLLAIVRCRAQVERTLGENTVRKCQAPSTYRFLAMSTAADSVVDGFCYEISKRMSRMRGIQADQYLNELQFLINTLNRYLSDAVLHAVEGCKNKLISKIGGGARGQGPDGLGAIERLERLGRIYVMCLAE